MIKEMLIVGIGGGLGSMARFLVQSWLINYSKQFPVGTFLINLAGCFIIGIFYALSERFHFFTLEQRLFLTAGICGGFTTFSAFALENILLFKNGQYLLFFGYIISSVVLGILFVVLGSLLLKI